MTDKSDRKRLETEVHQTDLKEDRINEDFLDGLKRYGPWVLIAVLAVISVRLWVQRSANAEAQSRDQAWAELLTTTEPASLEELAASWDGIDAVGSLARLKAGQTLLSRIATTPDMPEAERSAALDNASRQFEQVIAGDDGTRASTVVAVTAMNGLAAIAECRGDANAAQGYYERSATRADGWLEPLAAQARSRAATSNVALLPTTRPKAAAPPTGAGQFQLPPGLIPLGPGEVPPGLDGPATPDNAAAEPDASGDAPSSSDASAEPDTPAPAPAPGP
jgi:hypothetical protein